MVVSILHRATGVALSIAGLAILAWWLIALAEGPDAYLRFAGVATRAPAGCSNSILQRSHGVRLRPWHVRHGAESDL